MFSGPTWNQNSQSGQLFQAGPELLEGTEGTVWGDTEAEGSLSWTQQPPVLGPQ